MFWYSRTLDMLKQLFDPFEASIQGCFQHPGNNGWQLAE